MTTNRNTAEAIEHRIALVASVTEEIRTEEARTEWNAPLLKALYAKRLSHITEALQMGIAPSFLAMVTGNGHGL